MEHHSPSVESSVTTCPSNSLVRHLFEDLCLPLFFLARNLNFPMKMAVIQLPNFFHPFHKTREFLKLCPLVVSHPHRHIKLNKCFICRHTILRGLNRLSVWQREDAFRAALSQNLHSKNSTWLERLV